MAPGKLHQPWEYVSTYLKGSSGLSSLILAVLAVPDRNVSETGITSEKYKSKDYKIKIKGNRLVFSVPLALPLFVPGT